MIFMKILDIKFPIQNKNFQFCLFLVIVILTSFWTMKINWPSNVVFTGDDLPFHMNRVMGTVTAMKEGDFPFYINSYFLDGFGYGENLFYSNFMALPIALMVYIGFNLEFVYKLFIFVTTIITALVAFGCIKKLNLSFYTCTLFSIVYTFSAYRLFDVFSRAAFGEFLAFIFIPVVFLGVYYTFEGKKWYILTIGMSGLILSHLLSAIMVTSTVFILCIVYLKTLIKQPKKVMYLIYAALTTVLITLFFTLPMVEQFHSNTFIVNNPSFVTIEYFKSRALGLRETWDNFFMTGYVPLGFVPFSMTFLRIFIKRSKNVVIADISLILSLLFIIMSTRVFPYEWFSFLKILQFPWRFYELVTFFISLCAVIYLEEFLKQHTLKISNTRKWISTIVVIGLMIVSTYMTYNNYRQNMYQNTQWWSQGLIMNNVKMHFLLDSKKLELANNAIYSSEYLPIKVKSVKDILKIPDTITSDNTTIQVKNYSKNGNTIKARIIFPKKEKQVKLNIPFVYYKGYRVTINGKQVAPIQNSKGMLSVLINDPGQIKVYYSGTVIQKVSMIVSTITIFVLSIIGIYNGRKKFMKIKNFHQ